MIRALVAAALSAFAAQLTLQHATPIDTALPFIAAVVAVVGVWGVPLLVLAENLVVDDRVRLLVFGAVVALVFMRSAAVLGGWLAGVSPASRDGGGDAAEPADGDVGVPLAILLLRWIPFAEVNLVREMLLIAFAMAIFLVLRRTPFAMFVAIATAVATPAYPLRTFALPLAVLIVAIILRPLNLKLIWPSTIAIGFMLLFFPYSGIVARGLPYFLRPITPESPRVTLNYALAPRHSIRIDVPTDAKALIVSGANVAKLKRGAPLGRIEPGGIVVRIGDASDWGYMRRDNFYGARNPLPRDVAGKVREYGYVAWIDGAGRIALPPHARAITVTADASLPHDAALQVEAFELR